MPHFKLNLLVLFTVVFISITKSNAQSTEENSEEYSLLWEITGNGLNKPSYLFGTMHVRDKRAFKFPDSVLIALDQCEAMAAEIHFDSLMSSVIAEKFEERMLKEFYDMDEEESVFDSEDFDFEATPPPPPPKLDRKERRNLRKKDISTSRFKELEMLLNDGEEEDLADVFLDAYLFQRAKNLDKHLYGLEKIEDQYDLFHGPKNQDSLSSKLNEFNQLDSLSLDSLSDEGFPGFAQIAEKKQDIKELLTSIYQKGDISKVDEFINLFYGEASKKEWLLDRNIDMLKSMKAIMPEQSLFSAVGCAHLPGEGGLLSLLAEDGYTVRRVNPIRTGVAEKKMSEVLLTKWETVNDVKSGLRVQVPVKPIEIDVMAGLKTYVATDMVSNRAFVFYGVPCAVAGFDPDDPNIYDKMIDRMKEEGKVAEVVSQELITYQGHEGVEVKMTMINRFVEVPAVLRMFSANQFLYVLMSISDSDEINDRFFESLQFHEPTFIETDESSFKIEENSGFAANMKGVYEKNEIEMAVDASNPDLKMKMSQFIATDLSKSRVAAVFKTDLAGGQYFENDSMTIGGMMQELDPTLKYGEEYGRKFILDNGIHGFQPDKVINDGGMSIALRGFIRGPSFYLLMFQEPHSSYEAENANAFFDSFEFLPLDPDELSVRQIHEISIPLANEPVYSNFYDSFEDIEFTANNFFPNALLSTAIYKETLSKYAIPEPVDSIYANYKNGYFNWLEELVDDSVRVNSNGDKYFDTFVKTKGSTSLERRVIYYKNEAYYYFSLFISPELKSSTWLDNLISQITIEDSETSMTPEEKHQMYFDDLLSDDLNRVSEAVDYIFYMDFGENDLEQIKLVLNSTFEFEDQDFTSRIHSRMITKLIEIDNEEAIAMLKDHFNSTTSIGSRINALIGLKENDWTDLSMKDIIESNIELKGYSFDYSRLFSLEIKDSLALFTENIPSYLSHYSLNNEARNGLLTSMKNNLDTLDLSGLDVKNEVLFILNNAIDSIEYHRDLGPDDYGYYSHWDHTNTLNNIIVVSTGIQDQEIKKKILDIPFEKYELNPSAFLEFRIVKAEKVNKNQWKYFEEYGYGTYDLMVRLIEKDLQLAVPEVYRTEEKLAEMAFESLLVDDWGDIEVEEVLGRRVVQNDEEDVEVLFFVFKDEYSPEDRHVGFIEVVDEKKILEKSIWELLYDYNYQHIESDQYENEIQSILDRN